MKTETIETILRLVTATLSFLAALFALFAFFTSRSNKAEIQTVRNQVENINSSIAMSREKFDRTPRTMRTDNITVMMNNPNVGDISGKNFSWSQVEFRDWRNKPINRGADADLFFIELLINDIQGDPYLELCPIESDLQRSWEQPYNKRLSNPKEGKYVFSVYLHADNWGFHQFKLYEKTPNGRKPICSWVIE